MSNVSWAIATLVALALGVFFIVNHHHRDQADGLAILSNEIEPPVGDAEK